MKRLQSKKGFSVGAVIAVVVGLIMILAVAVPIAADLVSSANLSGTNALIAGVITTLLLVGTIVLVTRLYSA